MIPHLTMGLFTIWFFTGSVRKMEEFIDAVSNGKVFLMDDPRFLPENTPPDLPKLERISRLLLYDPHSHPTGFILRLASQVTTFTSFLGTLPDDRPWIAKWVSEMEETRSQAVAEIGKKSADALWASVTGNKMPDDVDLNGKLLQPAEKVSYW